MNLAAEIIKESIEDYKLAQAKARRDEIRKLLDYYTGTETEKYIDDYFSADAFREIQTLQKDLLIKCQESIQLEHLVLRMILMQH